MQPDDAHWMLRAIQLARRGKAKSGANPIGCVIVRDGLVLAEAYNEVDMRCDATAHAEIMAIRRAGSRLRNHELRGAVLYSTLEPCAMCTAASIWAKVGRIVFGAGRGDVHSMYFEERHLNTMDFIRDSFRDDLTLRGGVLAAKCAQLYVPPNAAIPVEEQFNR
jgi:tRNA(adenine34) deaminase